MARSAVPASPARLLLVLAGALLGVASLSGPAPAASVSCSPSGDSCLSTFTGHGVRWVVSRYAEHYVQNDRICVLGPRNREQCRTRPLRKSGGIWEVRVRWGRAFADQGGGTYRVSRGGARDPLVGWPSVTFRRPHRAPTHACGHVGFTPNSEDGAFAIAATSGDCTTAREVARASEPTDLSSYRQTFAFDGFDCLGIAIGTVLPQVQWSCERAHAHVTFRRS